MCILRTFCASLILATAAVAQVYISEITDRDLSEIHLDDGSVEEWESLFGPPSLVADDLVLMWGDIDREFDFVIWLGYHAATSRLYVAMERTDSNYVNRYTGEDNMFLHDGFIEVRVDGDRSGGNHAFAPDCCETEEERKALNNRQAQSYRVILGADGQVYIDPGSAAEWSAEPPYAGGGGQTVGVTDAHTVLEFYVTLFDELVWDSLEQSVSTPMPGGGPIGVGGTKEIGIDLIVLDDYRNGPDGPFTMFSLSGDEPTGRFSADGFAEAYLIAEDSHAECFSCMVSAVYPLGWARIKKKYQP
jgi:hypothetical protein